jgi:hypothetical protein
LIESLTQNKGGEGGRKVIKRLIEYTWHYPVHMVVLNSIIRTASLKGEEGEGERR